MATSGGDQRALEVERGESQGSRTMLSSLGGSACAAVADRPNATNSFSAPRIQQPSYHRTPRGRAARFLAGHVWDFYHSLMNSDSIVVMENGAGWPTWVDEEAGAVSRVVVLSKQPGEGLADFESRARARLGALAERSMPRRGVLICAPGRSQPRSSREQLVHVLLDIVSAAGGGEVVLIGDDPSLIRRLAGRIEELNRGAPVALRLRPPPSAPDQSAARRVA
jgi:hypothetical protein